MRRHEQFMNLAVTTARRSRSKFRLGAVLVKKNRVISWGINRMDRSHPIQARYSRMPFLTGLHAEIHSCLGVEPRHLEGATLYVARLLKNNRTALALPCEACRTFLEDSGVKKVYYTEDSNNSFTMMNL